MAAGDVEAVHAFLRSLQDRLCGQFAALGGAGKAFQRDVWERTGSDAGLGGLGITALLEQGEVFERGGVAFSDVRGARLPAAASARHPELAGRGFRALGVSVVMHPRNPHAPTAHMNVRCFSAGEVWWFGGGFDLTPYIPYEEDIVEWHTAARAACASVDAALYLPFRAQCDEYFFLKHRGEARGVGGIFYDDLNAATPEVGRDWQSCFRLMQAVGEGFGDAYSAIVARRLATPASERERRYQLQRRGRYVEFNLVFDRGTLFGLQSGGRAEAILMSMPPVVNWSYGSVDPELDAALLPYLTTRRGEDWLASGNAGSGAPRGGAR